VFNRDFPIGYRSDKAVEMIMKRIMGILGKIGLLILLILVIGVIAILIVYQSRVVTVPAVERAPATVGSYPIADTGQNTFWNSNGEEIAAPVKGDAFYGQDAQFTGNTPSYRDNGDGTVSDLVTGLMWTQSPDLNGDGTINEADKLTLAQAVASTSKVTAGSYSDWRLPTIKELYSLINFSGVDPRLDDTDPSRLTPFIDTRYFKFGYGDIDSGERIIDAQFATSTLYVGKTFLVLQTMFGVNFADGRIKGYPPAIAYGQWTEANFYVRYVRENPAYGVNSFKDNGDGTVTDAATRLMWSQPDSGIGMDWEHALAWAQQKNAEKYLGHTDWRLPSIKELQSIVDYTRAPEVTNSPAIDPVFNATKITNEAGQSDYACYWSSTTHLGSGPKPGAQAAYIPFGRSMGKMFGLWMDVHGAGSQRSDPKVGDPLDFPDGFGPQGDAIRINNFVRLVRNAD
jgi:hypothetical protein